MTRGTEREVRERVLRALGDFPEFFSGVGYAERILHVATTLDIDPSTVEEIWFAYVESSEWKP